MIDVLLRIFSVSKFGVLLFCYFFYPSAYQYSSISYTHCSVLCMTVCCVLSLPHCTAGLLLLLIGLLLLSVFVLLVVTDSASSDVIFQTRDSGNCWTPCQERSARVVWWTVSGWSVTVSWCLNSMIIRRDRLFVLCFSTFNASLLSNSRFLRGPRLSRGSGVRQVGRSQKGSCTI